MGVWKTVFAQSVAILPRKTLFESQMDADIPFVGAV
jgi:hypothetical protein